MLPKKIKIIKKGIAKYKSIMYNITCCDIDSVEA